MLPVDPLLDLHATLTKPFEDRGTLRLNPRQLICGPARALRDGVGGQRGVGIGLLKAIDERQPIGEIRERSGSEQHRSRIHAPCRRSTRDRPTRSTRPAPLPARRRGGFAPQRPPLGLRELQLGLVVLLDEERQVLVQEASSACAFDVRPARGGGGGEIRDVAKAGTTAATTRTAVSSRGGTDLRTARDAGDDGERRRGRSPSSSLVARSISVRRNASFTSPTSATYGVGFSAQVGQRGDTWGPRPFRLGGRRSAIASSWWTEIRHRGNGIDGRPVRPTSGGTPWRRRPPRRRR